MLGSEPSAPVTAVAAVTAASVPVTAVAAAADSIDMELELDILKVSELI
jgi:hypothetical protein